MSQERLNHLLVLHVQKDYTNSLDMLQVANIALLVTLKIGSKYLVSSTESMWCNICNSL